MKTEHPDTLKQEIEESLTAYLLEMREDNEKLLEQLKSQTRQVIVNEPPDHNIIVEKDVVEPVVRQSHIDPVESMTPVESVPPVESMPPVDEKKETYEPSLISKALALSDQGLDDTEIAKRLDKGKGEIELLLKFQKSNTKK